MLRSKLPETSYVIRDLISRTRQKGAVDLISPVPEFSMSQVLINLVAKYMRQGKNQYAPERGIDVLRQAIAERIQALCSKKYNPETEITVMAGSTEAIWATISALVHEDDEVLIIEPAFESYTPAVRMNGATPVFIPLKFPDYNIDWNEINRSVNQRTKMVIINNPHIPTGRILKDDDLKKLQKLVSGSKIVVLSDESYSNIVFDDNFNSVAKYSSLAKQSVIVRSFGKSLDATGWKTGFCLASADLTNEIRKFHNFICGGSNSVFQYALADYLAKKNEPEIVMIRERYKRKRDLIIDMLKGSPYKFLPCEGTYFQPIDYSEVFKGTDIEFATLLIDKYSVGTAPMSAFYHDKQKAPIINLCFAREDDVLEKGIENLLKISK